MKKMPGKSHHKKKDKKLSTETKQSTTTTWPNFLVPKTDSSNCPTSSNKKNYCQSNSRKCPSSSRDCSNSCSSSSECACAMGPMGERGPPGPPGSQGPAPSISGLFGNGSDGNGSLGCGSGDNVPNPLDRDYYFQNLTVCGHLRTAGNRIFVRGTLNITETGVIENNGSDAIDNCPCIGAPAGTLGGGTNGGLAGPGQNAQEPTLGGKGGNGAYPGGSIVDFTPQSGAPHCFNFFPFNAQGRTLENTRVSGGTGGGGSATTSGGSGGGIIVISAFNITGQGSIECRGGNGSNSAGATGGGGGGAIILNYFSGDASFTLNVASGSGFNSGSDGETGKIFTVVVSA